MTKITRAATAAAICAAVLLTGTACTGGDDGPKTSAKKSPPATPTAPAKPAVDVAEPNGDSVTEAPKIDRKTIASFANGQFGRNVPFKGGLHKGVLGIALNCTGKGTVKVDVPAVGVSFTEKCENGKVATIYNEMETSTVDPDAYIHLTGTSGVRWSFSAGQ
ncbi:hypothetical protein ADL01_05770 [Streptomyces sp. NRRL WC-3618]|uniref:hypothetical protein n=1 Tax=Streptomyces sp. NRRL WC-3618 TaxID=1519490 RepID=UPI0006AE413D|nr:hypothetical protein [Streptomyces sp. NRRL WC-3618]KOV86879.1 hypothetical protein ADL01_05770 [Streptomyces sp. NRRL WC-3618]